MLDSVPVSLIVGTVLGFLSGLGVGGGSLLILWLTMVLGIGQTTARTVNLLFFLPAAAVACVFRWKQGTISWKRMLPAITAGCIGAFIGTRFSSMAEPVLLKKLFGALLILTAIRELSYGKQRSR